MRSAVGTARALKRWIRPPGGQRLQEKIFFVHIPKCGGTSVSTAISQNYGLRERLAGNLVSIEPVASSRAAAACGMTSAHYRELLLMYYMARPKVRYISGHVHFSERAAEHFGNGWSYVTVLRHPVSKWFSQYFYNRFKAGEHSRVDQDLEGFLATPHARYYGNDYVRYLAPTDDGAPTATHVSKAVANLDRFTTLGILENLEKFAEDMHSRFGIRLQISRSNRSPAPRSARETAVLDEIRPEVERLCEPNLVVYRAAQRMLGLRSED